VDDSRHVASNCHLMIVSSASVQSVQSEQHAQKIFGRISGVRLMGGVGFQANISIDNQSDRSRCGLVQVVAAFDNLPGMSQKTLV
jgi:hypothetical protein